VKLNERIQNLADKTSNAFSHDRFGEAEWEKCVKYLLTILRLSDRQAEAVLRSKVMRWSADRSCGMPAKVNHLQQWFQDNPNYLTSTKLEELISQTPELN
jgi:hypothetical protein